MNQEMVSRILNPDLTRFKNMTNEQVIMLALAEMLRHLPASIDVNELGIELCHRAPYPQEPEEDEEDEEEDSP